MESPTRIEPALSVSDSKKLFNYSESFYAGQDGKTGPASFNYNRAENTERKNHYYINPPIKKTNSEVCKRILVPVWIFTCGASGLEAISWYMKGSLGMRFCEIAEALNRDDRTIWDAYSGAAKKMAATQTGTEAKLCIPVEIFRDRSLGILEILSAYLKEEKGLKYCKIARLLNKDDRTIWTACRRASTKRKNAANN